MKTSIRIGVYQTKKQIETHGRLPYPCQADREISTPLPEGHPELTPNVLKYVQDHFPGFTLHGYVFLNERSGGK